MSKRDGRSSLLTLTSKGRATISEAFGRMVALDRSICVNPNTAQQSTSRVRRASTYTRPCRRPRRATGGEVGDLIPFREFLRENPS